MSHPDCAFGYSQARLQARLGTRATAGDWQRLQATRDLPAWLQAAATSPLGAWSHELATGSTVHEAERVLRRHWLACVDEVAGWQPVEWQPAVAWLRWLPYVPALEKLARGGNAPEWMRNDAVLGPIVAEDRRQRAAAVEHSAFAPLARGFAATPDVVGAWLREWRRLWPARSADRPALEQLLRDVAQTRQQLAAASAATRSATVYTRLEKRLLTALRRHPLSSVTAIAWLGLNALDFLQVRGAVAWRALQTRSEAAA